MPAPKEQLPQTLSGKRTVGLSIDSGKWWDDLPPADGITFSGKNTDGALGTIV